EMGADIELFTVATRIPPWENLRALSRDELRRMHVHNADDGLAALRWSTPAPAAAPAAGAVPLGSALGWILVEKAGRRALVRRHPLTIEGQQIGSFAISFSCSERPDAYRVEYVEKRIARAGDSQNDRLTAVGLVVQHERALLKIESSN